MSSPIDSSGKAPSKAPGSFDQVPLELSGKILEEVSKDLRIAGAPSDHRLYHLACVSKNFRAAIEGYQGASWKAKVTVVYSDPEQLQEVEQMLKRCIKAKLLPILYTEKEFNHADVFFELNSTIDPSTPTNFKTWFFALEQRTVCRLGVAISKINNELSIMLRKITVTPRKPEHLKKIRASLLPLIVFLRVGPLAAASLEVSGLGDFHTAVLFQVISKVVSSRQDAAIEAFLESAYVINQYNESLGDGEAAFGATVEMFPPGHEQFEQYGFHHFHDDPQTTNAHIYDLARLHLFALQKRNAAYEHEIHKDEDLGVEGLNQVHIELMARADGALRFVGLEAEERDPVFLAIGILQQHFASLYQHILPSYKPIGFLQSAGQAFHAGSKIQEAKDRLKVVKTELKGYGASVPSVKMSTMTIKEDRTSWWKESYPTGLKKWWASNVRYDRPADFVYMYRPRQPGQLIPAILFQRWLDDPVEDHEESTNEEM